MHDRVGLGGMALEEPDHYFHSRCVKGTPGLLLIPARHFTPTQHTRSPDCKHTVHTEAAQVTAPGVRFDTEKVEDEVFGERLGGRSSRGQGAWNRCCHCVRQREN